MFDHLSVGVRSLGEARRFYDALLAPLGHAVSHVTEAELAYGPGGMSGQFYLYPIAEGRIAGLGAHVAFSAPSADAVDRAYSAAIDGGAVAVRSAGRHPDLSPDYYGTILFDPDGNKLEIVAAPTAA